MTEPDYSTVRVGVLGPSSTAPRRMMPVLRDDPGIELVAVASRDQDKAPAGDVRYRPELGGGALLVVGVYVARLAQYFFRVDDVHYRSCSHVRRGHPPRRLQHHRRGASVRHPQIVVPTFGDGPFWAARAPARGGHRTHPVPEVHDTTPRPRPGEGPDRRGPPTRHTPTLTEPHMHVALVILGTRGDIQPFVALGRTLLSRGHTVTMAAPNDHRDLITEAGLDHREMPVSPAAHFAHPAFVDAIRKGASFVRAIRKVPRLSTESLRDLADKAAAASDGADLVVNGVLCRVGMDEVTGPPWASVSFWPIHPTPRWPAMYAPKVRLGPLYNRLTHTLSGLLEYAMFRPHHKLMRSPKPRLGAPYGDLGRTVPLLLPVTRALWTGKNDWPAQTHVTGYWFLDRDWTPPAALVDFLDSGEPPVTMSFGSVWPVHRAGQTMEKVLNTIRSHGKRMVMVGGGPNEVPDDVFRIEDVHYPWLLSRSAAIIHHGGANTTGEALRAGIPQVIVPAFADCPFWAARMHQLGVAAKPLPFKKFTAERLDESLRVALNDAAMHRRAAEVSELVRAENGLADAVSILEAWGARAPRPTTNIS